MSAVLVLSASREDENTGVQLWRWTPEAYHRAVALGWFDPAHTRLIDGEVYLEKPISSGNGGQTDSELVLWKFDRAHYYAAGENGIFAPEARTERLFGRVYQKLTQGPRHTKSLRRSEAALKIAFRMGFDVRMQLPLNLETDGDPEPDLVVVPGSYEDYDRHPTQDDARLVVEISDSTLVHDQTVKAADFAEAGIPDYWIANLPNHTLEVRRDPAPMPDSPFGFGYRELTVYAADEFISPLALPGTPIRAADLLPPANMNDNAAVTP